MKTGLAEDTKQTWITVGLAGQAIVVATTTGFMLITLWKLRIVVKQTQD